MFESQGVDMKGRKRSLTVDTLGLLLAVNQCRSVQDRDAADDAVAYSKEKCPSLNTLFVDSAYAGKWAQYTHQTHAICCHAQAMGSRATLCLE